MFLGKWLFRQQRSKAQMISYYKTTFMGSGYAGTYVLADINRHGFLDQNTYVPGDPVATAFNEGRRAMALHIMNTLELNPNDYRNQFHLTGKITSEGDSDAISDEYDPL